MTAKDKFHDAVKSALQKERWNITDDPKIKSEVCALKRIKKYCIQYFKPLTLAIFTDN